MKPLNESVVLVTGAAGGIGQACVHAFLDAGAKVLATDLAGGDLKWPQRCRFIPADIRDEQAVAALIDGLSSLDVLVNNAAIFKPMAPVHKTSVAEFDQLIAVNLRGLFLCCKHAYPHLQKSKGC